MPFAITETWQLEIALSEDIPETTRLVPIGTCWFGTGDIILILYSQGKRCDDDTARQPGG